MKRNLGPYCELSQIIGIHLVLEVGASAVWIAFHAFVEPQVEQIEWAIAVMVAKGFEDAMVAALAAVIPASFFVEVARFLWKRGKGN